MNLNTFFWPLLLKNYLKLNSFSNNSALICDGIFPFTRSIKNHIQNGVINLDKPVFFNIRDLVLWIKKFLNILKIGQIFTLDKNFSGCLIVFIENSIRLIRSHTKKGKTLVTVLKFKNLNYLNIKKFCKKIENIRGLFFQSYSYFSDVKRQLKIRNIYSLFILEFNQKRNTCIIEIKCECNTYLKYLSLYLSIFLKGKCKIIEMRQINSGYLSEKDNLVSLHELLDSGWLFACRKDELYIRKAIMPLEVLLTSYKRIVVKNSAVNSICYGANLISSGILRAEKNIGKEDEVILITMQGEAIGLGISKINNIMLNQEKIGLVCVIKDIIMKRDLYPKKWGLGICSVKKNLVISSGFFFQKKKGKTAKLKYWGF